LVLVYAGITSLDGYVADAQGSFAWGEPDDEVHAFINDQQRSLGLQLYGRRLYEVMTAWETVPADVDSAVARDFAGQWRAADKIVYSTTLRSPSTARTRIEPRFDPAEVRRLLDASPTDALVGGPTLAAHALRAGLVDEVQQFVSPLTVGGGLGFLPDGLRLDLDLREERRFGGGVVFLRYGVRRTPG
jgi:dihydrofolate reductase